VLVTTISNENSWTRIDHNIYIRNCFAVSLPNLFFSKVDLPPATLANIADRLAVGSNDQMLIADSAQTPVGK